MKQTPAAAAAISQLPPAVVQAAESRLERFRRLIPAPLPPMSYLEWRAYLKDLQAFCDRVPEPQASAPQPDSPVQSY